MATLSPVRSNMQAQAAQIQRVNDLLNGVPGAGVAVKLTELRSAINPALRVRNLNPAGSHFQVLASSSAVATLPLFEVKDNGIFAQGVVVPTINSPDIFTNKKVNFLDFVWGEVPAPPASPYLRLFARSSDGKIYGLNPDGTLLELVNEPIAPPSGGGTTTIIQGAGYTIAMLLSGV